MQKYGQHFLKNASVLRRIAESIPEEDINTIIEIGPGHGELTEELLQRNIAQEIICVEKDPSLITGLKDKFKNDVSVKIVEGDALEVVPEILKEADNVILVGNIPYYITGFLFRKIGESERKPKACIFMVQKEVAQRIVAQPPYMNRLAASIQVWAEPKLLFSVSRADFFPKPQVDSAVLYLQTKKVEGLELKNYFNLVKIAFQQPRKTLFNNISAGFPDLSKSEVLEILKMLDLDPEMRPQNLRPKDIQNLSSNLKLTK